MKLPRWVWRVICRECRRCYEQIPTDTDRYAGKWSPPFKCAVCASRSITVSKVSAHTAAEPEPA